VRRDVVQRRSGHDVMAILAVPLGIAGIRASS
jgi:hypothetical protein